MLISSEQNEPHQTLLNIDFVGLFQTLGDKVRKCCSCLKMMMQAYLHVGFFTIFIIKRESLKQSCVYM